MRIPIDRQHATPLYRQIEAFLRQGILSGDLATGSRLPAIRDLAQDLGVNRITVENAYAELEADGLIESRVGAGTFVAPLYHLPPPRANGDEASWPLWQHELRTINEGRDKGLPSTEVLRGAGYTRDQPDSQQDVPITFAIGVGDRRLFPVEDLRKCLQDVLRRDGVEALDYGDARGYLPLRSTIAHVLASEGLRTRPENVLITAGSQQALLLVTQVLLKPGDTVLVESPTYGGALALFRASQLKIVGIPVDEGGMQVDKLEVLLQQHHPRLIYTIPTFHNPTGACMSAQRRATLIALADRYNVPILEDDFVGDFRYEGRTQPALKALDPGGRVIHVGTFSKMLMPGLRVGFLVAEGPVYESLVYTRRFNDIAASNLIQRAVEAYVTVGRFQAHLHRARQVYRKRRDTMLTAIRRNMPSGVRLEPPQGGLFIWLRLPDGLSSEALLPLAWQEGVTFAPGRSFFPAGTAGADFMRLNFACQPPELIDEGIRRLGRAVHKLHNA